MRITEWAAYVPPPGARFRIHYVPDAHQSPPDLPVLVRAFDRRPGVNVESVVKAGDGLDANVRIFNGDVSLLTSLGTFVSDGANFWRIQYVDRTDSGVPSKIDVTLGRVLDSALDPVQDVTTAATEAARHTVGVVAKVGIPTGLLIGAAVAGFLLARRQA